MWARSNAVALGCSNSTEISRHMSTPAVVQDMVEIIEAHAEWRSKVAEKWLASKEGRAVTAKKPSSHIFSRDAVIERTRWRKGKENLNYVSFISF